MTASPLTARFPLLDRPVAVPGACMCCNKSNVRVFDTRRNFKMFGAAYICEECILEMSRAMGLVPAEQVSAVREEAKQSILSILETMNLKVVTDELYAFVVRTFLDLPATFSDSTSIVHDLLGERTIEDAQEVSGESDGDSPAESESTEPVPDAESERKRKPRGKANSDSGNEGPDVVPSSSGNGDSAFEF